MKNYNYLEFKETITKNGYFYFIKDCEGSRTLGFIRVSKNKFETIQSTMSELYCFLTKHKEGVKTEHYCTGRVIRN